MACNILLFSLLLLTLASAELINEVVDQQLSGLNALNTRNELGLVELAPWSGNGTDFSRGFLMGVSSLERAGPAERGPGGEYRVPLRLGLLLLGFARVRTSDGEEAALHVRLPRNRLQLDFSLGQDCSPRVTTLELDLGPADLQSSPTLAQHQQRQVLHELHLFLNSKLKELIPELTVNLQIFCW